MKTKNVHVRVALLVIALCTISANYLSAQWNIYDGFSLPTQNNPAFLLKDTPSGTNYLAENIEDTTITDNYLFSYSQPDTLATTTYRYDIVGDFSNFTMVARVKGLPGATSADYFRIMEFDVRSNIEKATNKLQIRYDDTVAFEKPSPGLKAKLDSAVGWHLYRFTMEGKTFRLYVDENTTPLLESVSDVPLNSANYFKFGDGSNTFSVGGIIDWLIWNVGSTWAPGQGTAIPTELSLDHVVAKVDTTEPIDTTTAIKLSQKLERETVLYPTSASDYVNLTVHDNLLNGVVSIINILGVEVSKEIITSKSTRINLTNLPGGYYAVYISKNNNRVVRSLIIR